MKLRKERIFITQKVDKSSGQILRTVYPTLEAYQQELDQLRSSSADSPVSRTNLQHNNEIISYLGDVKLDYAAMGDVPSPHNL